MLSKLVESEDGDQNMDMDPNKYYYFTQPG
jgi:hypothetical protein